MNLHLSELESSWEPRLSRRFSAFVTNMTLKEEIVQQLCLTGFMTHFVDFSILKLFTKEWSEFQYYSRYLPNWHVSSMWQHLRDYSVNYIYSFYIKFCIIISVPFLGRMISSFGTSMNCSWNLVVRLNFFPTSRLKLASWSKIGICNVDVFLFTLGLRAGGRRRKAETGGREQESDRGGLRVSLARAVTKLLLEHDWVPRDGAGGAGGGPGQPRRGHHLHHHLHPFYCGRVPG